MNVKEAPKRVLLIEDNPGDIRLTQEAFKAGGNSVVIDVAMDGVEAIEWLSQLDQLSEGNRPDLILLDLNLPKRDGRDVLKIVKNNESLSDIPVIVLTTSNAEQDIYHCYELKANCYINKPLDFDVFFEIIRKVHDFWLT